MRRYFGHGVSFVHPARSLATAMASLALGSVALAQGNGFVPNRLLVRFSNVATRQERDEALASAKAQVIDSLRQLDIQVLALPSSANVAAVAAALSRKKGVEFAEPDAILSPSGTLNDTYIGKEWHLGKAQIQTAWQQSMGSSTMPIAVIDTGVNAHEDLKAKLLPGFNFLSSSTDTSDPYGHGTAAAGIIGAVGNNALGVAGVALNNPLVPLRVAGADGLATYSTMAKAITWAADQGIRIANVNYQISGSSTVTNAAMYMWNKGGLVVSPAGNDGTTSTIAMNPYIMVVSATDSLDAMASWSTRGSNIDVAAPGTGIYTTNPAGGYGGWSGTCFSSSNVSGIAALMLGANSSLTPAQMRDILRKSADDLGTAGWDSNFGYGRVNAARAVSQSLALLSEADTVPPLIDFLSPSSGGDAVGVATVETVASDNVSVASVSLYVDGQLMATNSAAPWSFSWNTAETINGYHNLRAVAMDAAGNSSSTQISVNVANAADTTPPTTSIASPTGGTVTGNFSVRCTANDNVAVGRVELWIDGKLQSSSTVSPYVFSVNARKWTAGAHRLQTRAYDTSGNLGLSPEVTVNR